MEKTTGLKLTRGLRNKNPLNIRVGDFWQGRTGDDGKFITFKSNVYGYRAAFVILRNYQEIHGIRTLQGIINRWAPKKENKTEAYIQFVKNMLMVQRDYRFDWTAIYDDVEVKLGLVRAMAIQENGWRYAYCILTTEIKLGYCLAFGVSLKDIINGN